MNESREQNFDFSNNEDIEAVNSVHQDKGDDAVSQKINKKDISREARMRAEKAILESLDLDSDASLDNFQEKLRVAIESIPRYQELEKKMADVPPEKLPYELFKMLQRSADSPDSYDQEKALHEDGVLVKQIKQGSPLMCAGRVMIASAILQKCGIEHSVVSTIEGDEKDASGHSVILLNVGEDKLAYFDAQNNLYFTFPKSALRGYEGSEKTSKCILEEFTPDKNDVIDGLNSINTKFITSPPSEGVASQYLTNISAALGDNEEFAHSGIVPDSEAKEAVDQIKNELIGENIILEKYDQRRGESINQFKEISAKKRVAILEVFIKNMEIKDDFIKNLSSDFQVNDDLIGQYPYLKNAPENIRQQAAEKIWDICKEKQK